MVTLPTATWVVGVPEVVGVVTAIEDEVDVDAEVDVVDNMPPTTLPRRPPPDEDVLVGGAEEVDTDATAEVVGVTAPPPAAAESLV